LAGGRHEPAGNEKCHANAGESDAVTLPVLLAVLAARAITRITPWELQQTGV